jgi:CTP:molybdopterin cytidylyltransferase MocA/molybdopterin converting factor small subunit
MGRPKLLLRFGGEPLIGRVVRALRDGGTAPVIVVSPPAEEPEGPPVADAARGAGASVVTPARRPRNMRGSVELGVAELERQAGGPPPALLLTPGDSPALTAAIVRRVLDRWAGSPESMVVPVAGGKRAHPLVLPWDLARQIPSLPGHLGVNSLIPANRKRVLELEIATPELAENLNTPEDLERWQARQRSTVTVRLFAVARERAGRAQIDVELPLPSTVGDLRSAISAQYPALGPLVARVMIAVEAEYASDGLMIGPGASIALIPPVSGGSGEPKSSSFTSRKPEVRP